MEQRVIIDFFSKNVNIDFNNEVCISKERLLELLIKHRVFLLFYNELSSDEKQKFNNNYKVTNYQLVKKKKSIMLF